MTTNSNKQIFVELQPSGPYFFGSERTFNTAEKDKYGESVTNYFAESNKVPQQTAILGLLRHTLLALNNCLNKTPVEKQKIIGDKNFDGEHKDGYGFIAQISPLVIAAKNSDNAFDFLVPTPFIKQKDAILCYSQVDSHSLDILSKDKTPKLAEFDHKKFSFETLWQDKCGKITDDNDIFYKLTKVGVNIEKNRKNEGEGFYKQTFYGLKKDFSFGVWVTFSDAADLDKLKTTFMPFGADQGLFKIIFHSGISCIFEEQTSQTKGICLLSDAYIDPGFFKKNIDFGITEFTDFRFLKSKEKDFYKLNNATDKSGKMRLLKRGSVLFTDKPEEVENQLKSETAYRNIGYNYYKFI